MPRVGDRDDAARDRDLLTGELVRIAAAVPALVMAADRGGDARPAGHAGQRLGAPARVHAHDLPLSRRQAARLVEDDVGHADLAEVVQARGDLELADSHQRQLQVTGDRIAERDDLLSMAARVAVAKVQQLGERADARLEHALDRGGALGVAPAQTRQGGKAVERVVEPGAAGRRGAADDRQRSELLAIAVADRDLCDHAEALEPRRRVDGATMDCAGTGARDDPQRAGVLRALRRGSARPRRPAAGRPGRRPGPRPAPAQPAAGPDHPRSTAMTRCCPLALESLDDRSIPGAMGFPASAALNGSSHHFLVQSVTGAGSAERRNPARSGVSEPSIGIEPMTSSLPWKRSTV